MTDVFVYQIDMPPGCREAVMPGWEDDYTVYINRRLSPRRQLIELDHAINHLRREDFGKDDVQRVEAEAHKRRL